MNLSTETASHRSSEGRGDHTRETLLGAATSAFALDGLHAVSTRQIAQDAGVNQALIGYHFGGKDGLYRAVIERAARRMSALVSPLLDQVEAALDGDAECDVLEAVLAFTDEMVAALLQDGSADLMQLILREQQTPTISFAVLFDGFMRRQAELLARVAERLQPGADETTQRLISVSIMGQLVIFRTAHSAVLRQLGWAEIGPAQLVTVQSRVRRNVTAILEATV
ncbi:CerR family C-terminal domain-containing protein [Microbacterium aurum]